MKLGDNRQKVSNDQEGALLLYLVQGKKYQCNTTHLSWIIRIQAGIRASYIRQR